MGLQSSINPRFFGGVAALLLGAATALAQTTSGSRQHKFPPGALNRIADLPPGRLRSEIQSLPSPAQQRALAWLRSVHFTELDLNTMHADHEGGIYYADSFLLPAAELTDLSEPVASAAAVPVGPFPVGLIFHSRPGAQNVLYLNFCGENVTGTSWNTSVGRTTIPAVAFSTDNDFATFSDTEQVAIKRIWERVAEDYAPFNIDVTTERPAALGIRVAEAVITRNTDSNGDANPSSSAGGVAYINVFATSSYATYRPAWIYFNNLGNNESYIAEAISHEIGHNMGLSHDGQSNGTGYYGGHGSGDTSWGPIMGTGYNRNVSQWSKGEYYLANNTQDDLATIAAKTAYRADDHGNTIGTASPLVMTGGTNVICTTPENDPDNLNPSNKGVLENNTDVDVFSFATGDGPVNLTVNPWISPAGTRGGNLDLLVELRDGSGTVILTNNPAAQTLAYIQTNLAYGVYYLCIKNTGVGDPMSSTPSGYTAYGSIGQYFISGYVTAASYIAPSNATLVVSVNNPAWGSVTPTNGTYSAGSTAQIVATPAPYYSFAQWAGDLSSSTNPLVLVLNTNVSVEAMFAEMVTTNFATPYWWLASVGYTNNFEYAVTNVGTNGYSLWQSYVAGLNPNAPDSQLRLAMRILPGGSNSLLSWNTVTGRVYSIWHSTNSVTGFIPLTGATNLPSTMQTFTTSVTKASARTFYRVQVRKP